MGRIIDYPEIQELKSNDMFLIDGDSGSKKISTDSLMTLIKNEAGTNISDQDALFTFLDALIPAPMRRNLFRGKNLGATVTADQYNQISSGEFQGMFLGDYWEIDGKIWRIVDFDYWLDSGDVNHECTEHHLVIMPDKSLYNAVMYNNNSVITEGYVGSVMYTQNLENAKTLVKTTFGETNILNHRELLVNSTNTSTFTGTAWYDSILELPNQIEMYGNYVSNSDTHDDQDYGGTNDNTPLALMQYYPKFINLERVNIWLRDVVTSSKFASAGYDGAVCYDYSSSSNGVRPVFGLKKG